jgi:hypothetical protein
MPSGFLTWETAHRRVICLLKHWNQVGQLAPDQSTSVEIEQLVRALPAPNDSSPAARTARTVVGAARHARDEALAVRESIVHEGADRTRNLVADFIATGLYIKPYPGVVDLVTDALLHVDLDDNPDNDEVERRVKRERDRQHRSQRLLSEIHACDKRIISLDTPLRGHGGDTIRTTLSELLPYLDSTNDLVMNQPDTWEDARIPIIMGRLAPAERAVALTTQLCITELAAGRASLRPRASLQPEGSMQTQAARQATHRPSISTGGRRLIPYHRVTSSTNPSDDQTIGHTMLSSSEKAS